MKLTPWSKRDIDRPIASLQREMNRLFNGFFGHGFPLEPFRSGGDWIPSFDIAETDENFVVKIELPGVDPKDVDITLSGDMLTIKGEKRDEKDEKTESYHRVERSYGSFQRCVRLPAMVKGDKVEAEFKNGLLTVHLPKAEEAKTKVVKIKVE